MTAGAGRTPGPFAEYVRQRREALGMTIAEMSERSDIPQNYISQIESGRILFPRRYLTNFATALGVSEIDLLRAGGVAPAEDDASSAPRDPAETALLLTWREIAPEDRELALEMLRLVERRKAEGSR